MIPDDTGQLIINMTSDSLNAHIISSTPSYYFRPDSRIGTTRSFNADMITSKDTYIIRKGGLHAKRIQRCRVMTRGPVSVHAFN